MGQPKVQGLNHLTLAVGDLARSLRFYRDLLGLELRVQWAGGAYLEAGNLWLCLSVDAAARDGPCPDYTHVAFDVAPEDFAPLCEKVRSFAAVWQENRSEGNSLYILDPDGHKLELHVGSLGTRLAHHRSHPVPGRFVEDRHPVPAQVPR